MRKISADRLRNLEPLRALSEARLEELAGLCFLESVPKGSDPFAGQGYARQLVYLVAGTMILSRQGSPVRELHAGELDGLFPLGRKIDFDSAEAGEGVELIRIDDDLLDLIMTWDQISGSAKKGDTAALDATISRTNWGVMSGAFSANSLKYGAFARLPPAHIDDLLSRFEKIPVRKGEVIIREGAAGDYYYVIESGKCLVERMTGGVSMRLAELKSGDAFGEEALVADAKRNASVSMTTDGVLLRLGKEDFVTLLKKPLLRRITLDAAKQRVAAGAQWIDVRFPSEFQYDKLPGAINIPLSEIRNALGVLNQDREYVLYCQSERRSSAAAFLLAQRGYRASVLAGGLWGGGAAEGNAPDPD